MAYSHYKSPDNPLREVLQAMTGKEPPAFVKGYNSNGLSDRENMELQDWCASNVKPYWLTGIGLLEAAEKQIQEAVANANIPPDPEAPKKVKASRKPRRSSNA